MIREARFHWSLCASSQNSDTIYGKIQGTREARLFDPCVDHLNSTQQNRANLFYNVAVSVVGCVAVWWGVAGCGGVWVQWVLL